MSARAQPNFCPYCGDTNLWPHEAADSPAAWECRSCLRAFEARMIGRLNRPEVQQ